MSRRHVDYTSEASDQPMYLEDQDIGPFRGVPTKLELTFKSKRQLKREVWDNAREKGWLV